MGVDIHRYADVGMTHDVLQRFGIHSGFCHIGAEGVPAYMRGDLGHLDAVDLVVLLHDVLQVFFPVQGDHWPFILVQKQKADVAVDHGFYFRAIWQKPDV